MTQADLRIILNLGAIVAAPRLLGCIIAHHTNQGLITGQIIEVEAYTQNDLASHSFNGETKRNAAMFGSAGTAYIYFTYGLHYCFNIVTGKTGIGEAVLIRAIRPLHGIDAMWRNRYHTPIPDQPPAQKIKHLANGPAKLVQALGINFDYNGQDLLNKNSPLQLLPVTISMRKDAAVFDSTRVGISKNTNKRWRWYIKVLP